MSFTSLRRPLAVATVLAAFGAASPAAAMTDLRSADARDAAATATAPQDLRSADARDAAVSAAPAAPASSTTAPAPTDLRSADAIDGRRSVAPLEASVLPTRSAESSAGSDFAWFEVGIGAAIALVLGGTALLAMGRRHALGGLRSPALHS